MEFSNINMKAIFEGVIYLQLQDQISLIDEKWEKSKA